MAHEGNTNRNIKLFLGNLSFDTVEDDIRKEIKNCGQLRFCIIRRWPDTNKSKGFGHIEFRTEQECLNAFTILHKKEIKGRNVRMDWCEDYYREKYPMYGSQLKKKEDVSVNISSEMHIGGEISQFSDEMASKKRKFEENAVYTAVNNDGCISKDFRQLIKNMKMVDIFKLLSEIQNLTIQCPDASRKILYNDPSLCYAILHAQTLLGIMNIDFTPLSSDLFKNAKQFESQYDQISQNSLKVNQNDTSIETSIPPPPPPLTEYGVHTMKSSKQPTPPPPPPLKSMYIQSSNIVHAPPPPPQRLPTLQHPSSSHSKISHPQQQQQNLLTQQQQQMHTQQQQLMHTQQMGYLNTDSNMQQNIYNNNNLNITPSQSQQNFLKNVSQVPPPPPPPTAKSMYIHTSATPTNLDNVSNIQYNTTFSQNALHTQQQQQPIHHMQQNLYTQQPYPQQQQQPTQKQQQYTQQQQQHTQQQQPSHTQQQQPSHTQQQQPSHTQQQQPSHTQQQQPSHTQQQQPPHTQQPLTQKQFIINQQTNTQSEIHNKYNNFDEQNNLINKTQEQNIVPASPQLVNEVISDNSILQILLQTKPQDILKFPEAERIQVLSIRKALQAHGYTLAQD